MKSAAKAQESKSYERNQLVSSLMKLKHPSKGDGKVDNVSKLDIYSEVALAVARQDPGVLGHFIAWNAEKGSVIDLKVALPVFALRGLGASDTEFAENAVAHMLILSPRELVRSYEFNWHLTNSQVVTSEGVKCFKTRTEYTLFKARLLKDSPTYDPNLKVSAFPMGISAAWRKLLERGLKLYLENRESNYIRFERAVLSHRASMERLYKLAHKKPSLMAQQVLFDRKYPKNSVLEKVRNLRNMAALEAAGTIIEYNIPFQTVVGALNVAGQAKSREVMLALIEGMTGNQLMANAKSLERVGVFKDTVLKAAFDSAVERAKKEKKGKGHALGAQRSSAQVEDVGVARQISSVQEARVGQLRSLDGDWAILGDASGSMSQCMEVAKRVAALITAKVSGNVKLIFFEYGPTAFDVTGLNYEEISRKVRGVGSGGATSIGSAMDYLLAGNHLVNGIAIISDGGENRAPMFAPTFKKYVERTGIEPTVYLLHMPGDHDVLTGNCKSADVQIEKMEVPAESDFYSLPNIVETLRANRYAFIDEVMETPLMTFERVFERSAA